MAASAPLTHLFKPLRVGAVELPNRFVMAPLTRCRATMPGHIPSPMMAEHYAQRASAGLIIAEATMILPRASAFGTEPGIFDQACIDGWKLTTEAVHKKGGRIFLQIWHGGRAAHPVNNDGEQAISSSAKGMARSIEAHFTVDGKEHPYEAPRALRDDELPGIVDAFRQAAVNARAAGFDGVEIHAANGYLLDQFWRAAPDARPGPYGGSIENRSRLTLEVTEAVAKEIGADRVGIRLSPLNSYNELREEHPEELTAYTAARLNELSIAYLHVMRGDFAKIQKGDVVAAARKNFKGVLITNMGYDLPEGEETIASGVADAICFGSKFMANPDLVERAKAGAPLNDVNWATAYGRTAEGYSDYPTMEEAAAAKK